jgi:ribosomal protein L40E
MGLSQWSASRVRLSTAECYAVSNPHTRRIYDKQHNCVPVRINVPRCCKRKCADQKSDCNQGNYGHRCVRDSGTKVTRTHLNKALSHHISSEVFGVRKHSDKQLFRACTPAISKAFAPYPTRTASTIRFIGRRCLGCKARDPMQTMECRLVINTPLRPKSVNPHNGDTPTTGQITA